MRNARTHSDEQVAQIAGSIREFGWTNPILVDGENGIVAGHGRVLAARKLGMDQVPCIELAGLSEARRRAYVLADNKLALNAGWDDALLRLELADLRDMAFDLSVIGFSEHEETALLAERTDGFTDPDDAPEVPETPVSAPGDLWLLGRHRLLCGDSSKREDVTRTTQGIELQFCFTSPPYASQRDYETGIGDWVGLMSGIFACMPLGESGQLFVNLGLVHDRGQWIPYWQPWIDWMCQNGWRRFAWYVWDQGPGLPGDWGGRPAPSHEFVFHFNRVGNRDRPRKVVKSKMAGVISNGGLRKKDGSIGGRSNGPSLIQDTKIPDSVIRVTRHRGGLGAAGSHPAVFPVGLPKTFIDTFTIDGGLLFEPFCGSGTTIIAAEQTGRACYAIEIAPAYIDVAVKRWQDFAGDKATLDGDGRTFDEIASERLPDARP